MTKMAERSVRLLVGIPCLDHWHAQFGMCLLNMCSMLHTRRVPGVRIESFTFHMTRSSLLPKSRRQIIESALERKFTHVLFIDSDQTFPSHTAHLMLSRNKAVVAANVPVKSLPSQPTARKFNPAYHGGDVVYTDPQSTGVEQVWRIGFGVMLINLSIMDKLQKPWFKMEYDAEHNEDIGEDWFFCQRLDEAGIPIYIDHDISQGVGHMGMLEFTHAYVGEMQKQDVA